MQASKSNKLLIKNLFDLIALHIIYALFTFVKLKMIQK